MTKNPYDTIATVPALRLTSTEIHDGQRMGIAQVSGIFGAGGTDTSPDLQWDGVPNGTKSFAISVYDPNAPTASGFWHWVVADIPAHVRELASGAGDDSGSRLPSGAWQLKNDAGLRRYLGAAPPKGHGVHTYFFGVHAVDVENIGVDHDASPAFLMFNLSSHTLARGVITAWWEAV